MRGRKKEIILRRYSAPRCRETPPESLIAWSRQIVAMYTSKAKFSRVTNFEEEPLKEEVWGKGLPDDVFCTVLTFLPLGSFVRMRCLCKKWSLMSQNQNFFTECQRLSPQGPCLVLTSRGGPYWTYEPALNAWTRLPPAFFEPNISEGACSQVTAAGGRLLFIRTAPHYSLMVYNPFNQTQQTLPRMFDMSGSSASEIHVVGMFVDTVRKYYNILVVDKKSNQLTEDTIDSEDDEIELNPITAQIYDSRTCSWALVEKFDPGYEVRMLNAALYANALHCLTTSRRLTSIYEKRDEKCFIVDEPAVYTVIPDGWEYCPRPVPTQDRPLAAPHLFSTRGRPMLAAAVPQHGSGNEKFPKWKSIIIWEFEMVDNVEEMWVKFAEIPLLSVDSFMVSKDSFIFLSEGDFLYFGSNTGSSLGVINIHTTSWWLLPPFPGFVPRRGMYAYAKKFRTFLYEPQPDV